MEFFRIKKDIPFMRHALVFNVISLLTFLLAVFFLTTRGLHLSVEFTGGTLIEVSYSQAADLEKIGRVKVIVPCAAITLVGRGMRSLLHKLSGVWDTFGRERVHMISQSSNDLNLTFVIDEADADKAVAAIHAAFIN